MTYVSASGCTEIPKGDQGIPLGTRVHHHLVLGVELFPHREFTYTSRSIHIDQKNSTQNMVDAPSHDALVNV